MYHHQHQHQNHEYVETEEDRSGNYGDPKSWLSNSNTNNPLSPNNHLPGNNLDRTLYKDLVEIVPLVQSLIDRKNNTSFTRRGSVIYTKTPSRKNDPKNRNGVKSTIGKKNSDKELLKHSKSDADGSADDYSAFAANMAAERDSEELKTLREQLEELHQKIMEKDELLKAAETSKSQMISVQAQLDELKRHTAEKDSLIKSTQQHLNDAKIKLADKQAALEKLQWEAKTSNQKVERLQEELDSMQSQISSLMIVFEGLSKDNPITPTEDYDITPYYVDHLPDTDNMDEIEMQKMEEAREAYVAAVALAKERQDEESLAAAARARLHLQSFVLRTSDD